MSKREQFDSLLAEWREQSGLISSADEMSKLDSAIGFVEMGDDAVTWILEELEVCPDCLFFVLRAITLADPVLPAHQGVLSEMTNDWLKWGRDNGYL